MNSTKEIRNKLVSIFLKKGLSDSIDFIQEQKVKDVGMEFFYDDILFVIETWKRAKMENNPKLEFGIGSMGDKQYSYKNTVIVSENAFTQGNVCKRYWEIYPMRG